MTAAEFEPLQIEFFSKGIIGELFIFIRIY